MNIDAELIKQICMNGITSHEFLTELEVKTNTIKVGQILFLSLDQNLKKMKLKRKLKFNWQFYNLSQNLVG